ncbi:hypothetical protein [Streptomyces sp. NPDC056144]
MSATGVALAGVLGPSPELAQLLLERFDGAVAAWRPVARTA